MKKIFLTFALAITTVILLPEISKAGPCDEQEEGTPIYDGGRLRILDNSPQSGGTANIEVGKFFAGGAVAINVDQCDTMRYNEAPELNTF